MDGPGTGDFPPMGEQPPQNQEEAMRAIFEQMAMAQERTDRGTEDNDTTIGEEDKKIIVDAYKHLISEPDLDDAKKEQIVSTHVDIWNDLKDKSELTPEQASDIAGKLASIGIRQDHETDIIFDFYPNLTPEARQAIKEKLPPMNEEEKAKKERGEEELSEEDTNKIDAMRKQAEERAQAVMQEINESDLSDEEKAEKIRSVQGLLGRIKDFFGPETRARTISRRVGKTVWFSFLALCLIVILEMNLINKAAGRKR